MGVLYNPDPVFATAVAGAATANGLAGQVTSEALTTAGGADYVLTITNSQVNAKSVVVASKQNGTNTAGVFSIVDVKAQAGSVVITLRNITASTAANGTIKVSFDVVA